MKEFLNKKWIEFKVWFLIWNFLRTHYVDDLEEKFKKFPCVHSGTKRIYTLPNGGKMIFDGGYVELLGRNAK